MSSRKSADGIRVAPAPASLTRLIARHVMLAAMFAVAIQTIICLAENLLDDGYFTRWLVRAEVETLSAMLDDTPHGVTAVRPPPKHYDSAHAGSYAYRIFDGSGHVIAEANLPLLQRASPVSGNRAPQFDLWHRQLDTDHPYSVVGGMKRRIGRHDVWVEVVTLGDPANRRYIGLWRDFVEDVFVPQVPTIMLTALMALLSVSFALRPLARASSLVADIQPSGECCRVETRGLPREVAAFADGINRLLDRYATLVAAQDQFISRAAHQLRTPLAIIMLELGRLKDDHARRIEADIAAMSETVDRLLELSRLQSGHDFLFERIDIDSVVRELVEKLTPLAAERQSRITAVAAEAGSFLGDLVSFREAIRNLITNAVVHTPPGTRILVTSGPGASVTVEDDGPGLGAVNTGTLFEPFVRGRSNATGSGLGLAIVRQAALMHGGSVHVAASRLGGALFRVSFGGWCDDSEVRHHLRLGSERTSESESH